MILTVHLDFAMRRRFRFAEVTAESQLEDDALR